MKELAMKLFRFVSEINLGIYYPLIVPSAIALVFLSLFIIGIFCYRVKRADKTSILALTLSVYTLSVIKTICDFLSKPIRQGFVLSCTGGLFMSALSFAFYGLLCLQYNSRLKLNMREKRLIDGLSRFDDDLVSDSRDEFSSGKKTLDGDFPDDENELKPSLVKRAFFDTPVKRIERLETFKPTGIGDDIGYGISFSEILCYLEKLKRHELTDEEKELVFSLEKSVRYLSGKQMTCEERKELSSKLMQLIKLVSKYKAS